MPPRPLSRALWAGLLAALLAGCGSVSTGNAGTGTLDSGTTSRADVMTFRPTSVPVGYVGETYSTLFGVTGGVGPYGYRLTSGTLPPGLKIANATLSGTPTKSGSYTFSVQATDANLSTRVQEYTMKVEALPPLSLEATLPPSEIRGETRIPLVIKSPRTVRAARFVWDLGKNVSTVRVQPSDPGSILFWQQKGSLLTVDVGFRTVPRPNSRVALITVKPVGSVRLSNEKLGYEARDGAGKILAEKKWPVPAASAPAPAPDPAKPAGPNLPAQQGPAAPAKPSAAPSDPAPAQPGLPQTPANVNTSPLPSPATPTPSNPPPAGPTPAPAPTGPQAPAAPGGK